MIDEMAKTNNTNKRNFKISFNLLANAPKSPSVGDPQLEKLSFRGFVMLWTRWRWEVNALSPEVEIVRDTEGSVEG